MAAFSFPVELDGVVGFAEDANPRTPEAAARGRCSSCISRALLHYSNNPGEGHGGSGGTCFGDSGGPVISEDGYIVAVNSFVLNNNCNGAGFGYRVDTQLAHDFVVG